MNVGEKELLSFFDKSQSSGYEAVRKSFATGLALYRNTRISTDANSVRTLKEVFLTKPPEKTDFEPHLQNVLAHLLAEYKSVMETGMPLHYDEWLKRHANITVTKERVVSVAWVIYTFFDCRNGEVTCDVDWDNITSFMQSEFEKFSAIYVDLKHTVYMFNLVFARAKENNRLGNLVGYAVRVAGDMLLDELFTTNNVYGFLYIATMLDRPWARGQTKCNTPLMLAT